MAFNRERALASAAKYAGRGQHDRAAREYQAIVEADPSDIRSWVMLADCLVRAGDTSGAIDRFSKVADFYAANDEPTKAIAVYRQILSLDASRLDVHLKIAERLHAIGRTPDAIATYEFVAQSFFQAGKVAEGLEGFRMVAELDVGAVAKRLRVAELYSREGRKEAAVEHFRLAAQRLLAKNRYDDYIRVAERLLYHKDDDADILRSLAELYLVHAKEPRRALMKLNGLLRVSPSDPLGLELLADTFVALGKQDKAISVAAELAKDLRKGDAAAKREAARILKKALAWSPESPDELRSALAEVEGELAAIGGGEPEVLIDVADELEDDLDLDVDIDEDGDDFELGLDEEIGDDGYDVTMTAAEKLVLETRVYIRYKMYEHALAHIDGLLDADPKDLEAIELRADVLDRMGRLGDAADLYVHLAQLVGEADAVKAERFLDQAVALVPDHAKASMMMTTLEAVGRGGSKRPAASKPAVAEAKPPSKPAAASKPAVAEAKPAPSKPATSKPAKAASKPAKADKPAETKSTKPLFGGGTPLPSLLPKRDRTPLPGRIGTPLPGLPPRREVTPAPGVLGKRDEGSGAESPVTTDDSGLLRFSAPKKRPPPPPPGRGRRRPSVSRGKPRGDDDDTSEGDSEASKRQGEDGEGAETLAVEDVLELEGVELIDADELELVDAEEQPQSEEGSVDSDGADAGRAEREPDAPAAVEPVKDNAESDGESDGESGGESDGESGGESEQGRPRLGFLPTRGRSTRRLRRRESGKIALVLPRGEAAPAELAADSGADSGADSSADSATDAAESVAGATGVEETEGVEDRTVEAGEAALKDAAAEETDAHGVADVVDASLADDPGAVADESADADADLGQRGDVADGAEIIDGAETVMVEPAERREGEAADRATEAEVAEPADELAATVEADEAAERDTEVAEAEVDAVDADAETDESETDEAATDEAEADKSGTDETETDEAQIEESETDEAETEESEADKSGTDEAETDEAETDEAETDEAETEESETEESETEESETEKSEADKSGTDEAETDESETGESEADKSGTDEAETDESEADKAGIDDAESEADDVEAEAVEAESEADDVEAEAVEAESEIDDVEAEVAEADDVEAESDEAESDEALADAALETLEADETDEDELEVEGASDGAEDPGSIEEVAEEAGPSDEAEEPARPEELAAKYPEIQEELEELLFFINQGFDDDATVVYMELVGRHPGHPALEPYAERFAALEEPAEEAAAPVVLDDDDGEQDLFPEDNDEPLEAPVFDFEENDEEDDFLSSIFDEEPSKPAKAKSKDPPRARAELEGNADARTLFDLGTAYREMGLIDDALAQFRAASRDGEWKARALVMMASLHLYRGELPEAIADLEEAVAFAVNDDERSEARYELGVIYQVMGETAKAVAALEAVLPGYRDRDDRLAALAGG